MRTTFQLTSLFALVGSLAVAAGACGDDDSPGDGAASDASPPAADAATHDAGGDAAVGGGADGGGDLSGLYLLSIQRPIGAPIRFLTTVTYLSSGSGGRANFSLQPLKVEICPEVGNGGTVVGTPIAVSDAEVETDGSFAMMIPGAMITGQANPTMCFDVTVTLRFAGALRGDGLLCGTVSGPLTLPPGQSFDGSTFGAIRVAPGTIGDDRLPDPVTECPTSGSTPDGDARR
ncbi:MAG TPA: hypothetical protein VK698_16530 [Kofleriaceae bacterium]|nr:hypothetical protein [Kofleriaceae bacterium]